MGVIFLTDQFFQDDTHIVFPRMPTLGSRDAVNSSKSVFVELKHYEFVVFRNEAWYGMAVLAVFLLTFCALLAGLTLAVCGLDTTLVELKTVTGSEKHRKQAIVVARMKRRGTWILCSLVLCSVACGESLPIIIQGLEGSRQHWITILASTLMVAIVAEILPQYIIPHRAISWAYHCRPIIWGCMWLTAIISYPLALLLDHFGGSSSARHSVFTNDDIAGILKYHDRSQKRGGMLGQDTLRVMLGALNLDSCGLGGLPNRRPKSICSEVDLEKASLCPVQDMIVKWPAVKTVDINDTVDAVFIERVKSYSFSRLPVVGGSKMLPGDASVRTTECDGIHIYGFLHVRNLLGVNLVHESGRGNCLQVRDFPIYPLPIVTENMAFYDLLNLFQLGMSRIAIVATASQNIPWTTPSTRRGTSGPAETRITEIAARKYNENANSCDPDQNIRQEDRADGFLKAEKETFDEAISVHQSSPAMIKCSDPIGIVTFEDLIDTLLQKSSLDERDYFDRCVTSSQAKAQKARDFALSKSSTMNPGNIMNVPAYCGAPNISLRPSQSQGTLSRRKVSNGRARAGAMDGADEDSIKNDGSSEIIRQDNKSSYYESSYTQNSLGGFHKTNSSGSYHGNTLAIQQDDAVDFVGLPSFARRPCLLAKIASLPCLKNKRSIEPTTMVRMERHASLGPKLPPLPIVTFAPHTLLPPANRHKIQEDNANLVLPIASMFCMKPAPAADGTRSDPISISVNLSVDVGLNDEIVSFEDARERVREKSGETISLSTLFDDSDDFSDSTEVYEAQPAHLPNSDSTLIETKAKHQDIRAICKLAIRDYDGFPVELLDSKRDIENQVPAYASHTFPRMADFVPACGDDDVIESNRSETIRDGNQTSGDDRAMSPSQRKKLLMGEDDIGIRSSSFWY